METYYLISRLYSSWNTVLCLGPLYAYTLAHIVIDRQGKLPYIWLLIGEVKYEKISLHHDDSSITGFPL